MFRYSVGSWDRRRSGLDVVRYRDSLGSWSVSLGYGSGFTGLLWSGSRIVLDGNVSWLRKALDGFFSGCGLGIRMVW